MIPGIGPVNALTILAEVGDARRYAQRRQYLMFCGLDQVSCQSGTFRGRTKLSKHGNVRSNNSFRDKLGRYMAGHGNDPDRHHKAMTALTAKMARVAHVVSKSGTEHCLFVERAGTRWKDPTLCCGVRTLRRTFR